MVPNDAICPIPWNHIAVQQNGQYRICCLQIHKPFGQLTDSTNKVASITSTTVEDVRNFTEIKDLRKNMLDGVKDPLCRVCYEEDNRKGNSKRQIMLDEYGPNFVTKIQEQTSDDGTIDTTVFPVTYMDIRFGNLCNLKCRYCGPTDSSLWYEDAVKLSGEPSVIMRYRGQEKYEIKKINNTWDIESSDFKWHEQKSSFDEIVSLIPHVTRYYLTGGEPTVNKTHFKLLQAIIDTGYASKVTLEYNSNMFAIPDKLYELWTHFKLIILCCSIDGINDMANYLRPPSTWDRLEQNLDKVGYHDAHNIWAVITPTITVYNVLHILDVAKLVIAKNYKNIQAVLSSHCAIFPSEQSIQVLPAIVKTYIRSKYQEFFSELEIAHGKTSNIYTEYYSRFNAVLAFMDEKDDSHLLPILKNKTIALDAIRNHRLEENIPWLYDILKDIG